MTLPQMLSDNRSVNVETLTTRPRALRPSLSHRGSAMADAYLGLHICLPGLGDGKMPAVNGRASAIEAIDALRRVVVAENPLGPKQQQLVQFGQLLVLCERQLAGVHADTARRAGASASELIGVVETALLTAGMPAYTLGISTLDELLHDHWEAP